MTTETMQRVSATELKNKLGDVLNKATKQAVIITQHNKDRFVLMDMENFRLIRNYAGKAFKTAEMPDELAELAELGYQQLLARKQGHGE